MASDNGGRLVNSFLFLVRYLVEVGDVPKMLEVLDEELEEVVVPIYERSKAAHAQGYQSTRHAGSSSAQSQLCGIYNYGRRDGECAGCCWKYSDLIRPGDLERRYEWDTSAASSVEQSTSFRKRRLCLQMIEP